MVVRPASDGKVTTIDGRERARRSRLACGRLPGRDREGAGYNFKDTWGITRLRFDVFTLGTPTRPHLRSPRVVSEGNAKRDLRAPVVRQ
jgi:hypothetical protein